MIAQAPPRGSVWVRAVTRALESVRPEAESAPMVKLPIAALLTAALVAISGLAPAQGSALPKSVEEAVRLRQDAGERAAAAEKESTHRGLAALDEARVLRRLVEVYANIELLLKRESELSAEVAALPARREAAAAKLREPASTAPDAAGETALQDLGAALARERGLLSDVMRRLADAEHLSAGGGFDERERVRKESEEAERARLALQTGSSSLGPTAEGYEQMRIDLRAAVSDRWQRYFDARDRAAPEIVSTVRAELDAQRAAADAVRRRYDASANAYIQRLDSERRAAEAEAERSAAAAQSGAPSARASASLRAAAAEMRADALRSRVKTARLVYDDSVAEQSALERARFQELRSQLDHRSAGNEERWIESYHSIRDLRRSKQVQDFFDELRALARSAKQARAEAAAARRADAKETARAAEARRAAAGEFAADLAARRAAFPDAAAFLADYDQAAQAAHEARAASAAASSRLADAAGSRAAAMQQFLETLDEEEQYVRARGLFVRVGTQIDFDSLRTVALDGVALAKNAPAILTEYSGNARQFLSDGANLPRVLLAALLLPLALLLSIVTRRAAIRLSKSMPSGHALTVPERGQRLLVGTARRMALSVFVVAAIVTAVHLSGASPTVLRAVETGSLIVLLVRLALAVVAGLLRPDDAALRLVPVCDATARYVSRVAVLASLPFTAIAVPRGVLEAVGYAQHNPGFLELMARVEQGLVTIAIVMVFARESVLEDLLPKTQKRGLSTLRALVLRLRPAALFFAVAVFVLRLLGYEFLARYLTSISIGGTAIVAAASVAHRGLLQLWERALPKLKLGPAGDDVAEKKSILLTSMVRVAAAVGCTVGAYFAIAILLRVGTSDFEAVDVGVVGGRRFSAMDIVFFVASLAATGIGASWTRRGLTLFILPQTKMDLGTRYAVAVTSAYLVIVVGFVGSLGFLGFELRDFAIVLGAAGFGVGLGMQESASNFLHGLILLFSRPVKVGDVIESEGRTGEVTDITITTTRILTPENYEILIPNREIVGRRLVNQTGRDPRVRGAVRVGVAYGTDPDRVRATLLALARARKEILARPEPMVVLLDLADSALVFELRFWTPITNRFDTETALRAAVPAALAAQGVDVPFPQRDLNIRGPVVVQVERSGGAA